VPSSDDDTQNGMRRPGGVRELQQNSGTRV
jgi:hypothetical protein